MTSPVSNSGEHQNIISQEQLDKIISPDDYTNRNQERKKLQERMQSLVQQYLSQHVSQQTQIGK